MSKRRKRRLIRDLSDDLVSANECTGLLQSISLDPEEIAEFHREYNKDK